MRLTAARIRRVGRFLLGSEGGAPRPAEAAICGAALAEGAKTADWRQAGWALKGAAEEADGLYSAAIASYRRALAEGAEAPTEDLPAAALALGELEMRAGERSAADTTLSTAVRLAARDPASRVKAYLALSRNSAADGRPADAKRYATVVKTLFNDEAASIEADRILATLDREEAK